MVKRRSDSGDGGRAADGPAGAGIKGGGPASAVAERERADALRAINELATELAEAPSLESIYEAAGGVLRRVTGAEIVSFAAYNAAARELEARYVSASDAAVRKSERFTQNIADALRTPVNDYVIESMLSQPYVKAFEGLHELSNGRVPKREAGVLKKAIGFGVIYVVALRQGDEVSGGIAAFMPEAAPAYSAEILENFANLVAAAIRRKQVEDELRNREAEYKKLAEGLTDVVLRISPAARIEYISPAITNFGGYEPAEMLGRSIAGYFARKTDFVRTLGVIEKVILEKKNAKVEFLFRAKDRDPFFVEVTGEPVVEHGRVASIQCAMRDVSDRKRAEEDLRLRAADLRRINDLAIELPEAASLKDVYKIAADRLRDVTGARAVFITSFGENVNEMTLQYVSGGTKVISKITGAASGFTAGAKFPISDEIRGQMLSLRVKSYAGLHELSQGTVPGLIAASLEKALGAGTIHAVALRYGGELLGGVAVVMRREASPYSYEILENFGNVAAAAIRRKEIEEELRSARDGLEERVRERTAELTEALNRLRESEETYRGLVRMSPDGVTFVDVSGKITYASLQTARLHGFEAPEELIGRDGFELVAPEERERAAVLLRRALEEGVVSSLELSMAKKDGARFYAELNAVLLRDDAGTPKGLIVNTRDITERKRAEDELRRALAENEALLEAIPDLMFIINKEGTYVDFKRAAPGALALEEGSIIGKNVRDTGFSAEAEDLILKRLDETLRTGVTAAVEYELDTPGGRGVFEARLVKLNDDEVLSVVRDVTERRAAEEALRRARDELEERVRERTAALKQSNEDLRTFMYIVSHDMRAPLVNLRGFAGELRTAMDEVQEIVAPAFPHIDEDGRAALATKLGEDVPEALGFIDSSVKRMDNFINGVLKLSRLGRRELEYEPLNMEEIVRETMDTLHHQLEQRDAKFAVGPLPGVVADRTSMEQVVGNLLANAVMYLDPARPGEITVTGEARAGEAVFRVRDTGRGIASRDLQKIFEPFSRAGEDSVPGEGMGLAYVRALVGRHGGCVWCESEPSVGTTFTFTIPLGLKEGVACD